MHVKRYQKMSALYAPTLKEDPAEAELASHRLLLRAGMIRKTAAGLYSYLPLAWRSIRKIEAVIRDEMEGIGAQEMMVPILTPAELWHESGRWDAYGPELMRIAAGTPTAPSSCASQTVTAASLPWAPRTRRPSRTS